MEKRWYNVEIPGRTQEAMNRAAKFKTWLSDEGIRFETSGCFDLIHFEIELSPDEVEKVDEMLDSIVWFDSIEEA